MSKLVLASLFVVAVVGFPNTRHFAFLMAQSAASAMRHDQLSYAKFTKAMVNAKPRKPAQQ